MFNMVQHSVQLGDVMVCEDGERVKITGIHRGGNTGVYNYCSEYDRYSDAGLSATGNSTFDIIGFADTEKQTKPDTKMLLSNDSAERKQMPITTGFLDYFPLAVAEVAKCSKAGNDQHHPGKALHWDKSKSTDHADCIARHLIDRDSYDTDGIRHSVKLAWRALAYLQIQLENEKAGK